MKLTHIIMVLGVLALSACTERKAISTWKDMLVVAHTEMLDGEPLTVCSLESMTDTVSIPLSALVEELQFVKLDNREEALIGMSAVSFSDNYILSHANRNVPCKLFRKDGTYINKVGSIGQGPGEYRNIYDAQIDEKHGRIYLLPWTTNRILVYNLEGKYESSIPLNLGNPGFLVPKGTFRVDADKGQVSVVLLPFNHLPVVAWVQDMEGNIIHEVPSGHLKIQPDFSNEVVAPKATKALSFHISTFFELRKDTLYHFDTEQGKLLPRFTLDYGNTKMGPHDYFELPDHYCGSVSGIKQTSKNIYEYDATRHFIVEKATGKGSYCRIYDDYLYDREVTWVSGMNGYYYRHIEPVVLLEEIEESLAKHPEWSEERRTKLEKLKKTIDEDDNNYLFYGKLKGRP